jgi:C4-dicarboxylate transporter DctM subunit
VRFGVIVREVLPFVIVLVAALMVLTYVPWVSLWLPTVIYK